MYKVSSCVFASKLSSRHFEDFKSNMYLPIKGEKELRPPKIVTQHLHSISPQANIWKGASSLLAIWRWKNILWELQYGFRKGHSTSQSMTEISENVQKTIDNNMSSCGVIFEPLQIKPWCCKLTTKYCCLSWIYMELVNYLTYRKQYTSLESLMSLLIKANFNLWSLTRKLLIGPMLFLIEIKVFKYF